MLLGSHDRSVHRIRSVHYEKWRVESVFTVLHRRNLRNDAASLLVMNESTMM